MGKMLKNHLWKVKIQQKRIKAVNKDTESDELFAALF